VVDKTPRRARNVHCVCTCATCARFSHPLRGEEGGGGDGGGEEERGGAGARRARGRGGGVGRGGRVERDALLGVAVTI
jgi:hypothetical protein